MSQVRMLFVGAAVLPVLALACGESPTPPPDVSQFPQELAEGLTLQLSIVVGAAGRLRVKDPSMVVGGSSVAADYMITAAQRTGFDLLAWGFRWGVADSVPRSDHLQQPDFDTHFETASHRCFPGAFVHLPSDRPLGEVWRLEVEVWTSLGRVLGAREMTIAEGPDGEPLAPGRVGCIPHDLVPVGAP